MFNAMKKIFSLAIVLCAVAMVSCCGNANKKAATAETTATETAATKAACDACTEKCDSAASCCEKGDAAKSCCDEAAK